VLCNTRGENTYFFLRRIRENVENAFVLDTAVERVSVGNGEKL
jgi:hypothetical protein